MDKTSKTKYFADLQIIGSSLVRSQTDKTMSGDYSRWAEKVKVSDSLENSDLACPEGSLGILFSCRGT